MSTWFSASPTRTSGVSRPIVQGLFVASCLLSIVSWYTTQQGMALYLAPWFAFLASLGVQSALVLVAWLIGFTRTKRALLIIVYILTAAVSIFFSYGSLFTWFSVRERPATIERKLYDAITESMAKSQELLVGAISEGQKHALALEEMTNAERIHGYISRSQDADPYLTTLREAVAREAESFSSTYKEGPGSGLRYTAFERHAKLVRDSVQRLQQAQRGLAEFRSVLKPLDSSENQLRGFRQVYDSIPWQEVRETLHDARFALPPVPAYTEFVDRTASSQEDLMVAFQELLTAPTNRHIFAFALAAFIDIIVFLLAYGSGPYFFGSPEERWISAAAALDSSDPQVFARDFLRKLGPGPQGIPRADGGGLTPGEMQLCLLLVSRGLAVQSDESGRMWFLLDKELHERLMESLAYQRLPLRAAVSPSP